MLRHANLKETRSQFLSMTGVTPEEFERYLQPFIAAYEELYHHEKGDHPPRPERISGSVPGVLEQMEDKLLIIWMHHKMQLVPLTLGLRFGLSEAQTHDWIDRLLPAFQLALTHLTEIKLQPICIQFLHLLNHYQVEYLVIGGHAVAYHGYQRPILDLDIFVATHPLNAKKLVEVLQAFGHTVAPQASEIFQLEERVIRIGQPPFSMERFAPDDRFIQLGLPPIQLEIMTSISGVSFEECFPERVSGVIDDVPLQIIGLAQLKANKRASIRMKDADDLAHLKHE